jgi:hypothetical protein
MEGLRCSARGIECASASSYGAGTSASESHEGSDGRKIGHGGVPARECGPKDRNFGQVCKHL